MPENLNILFSIKVSMVKELFEPIIYDFTVKEFKYKPRKIGNGNLNLTVNFLDFILIKKFLTKIDSSPNCS